jgi:hypothetical protein
VAKSKTGEKRPRSCTLEGRPHNTSISMAKLYAWPIPFRSVDWARTTVIILSQVITLRWIFCNQLCTETMQPLIQQCLNVREPRCYEFRPFVKTHFNTSVSTFCEWVRRKEARSIGSESSLPTRLLVHGMQITLSAQPSCLSLSEVH